MQTDRQTDRQTDSHIHRHTQTHIDIQTCRHTDTNNKHINIYKPQNALLKGWEDIFFPNTDVK